MKIVAIKEMSAGNDSIGDMWKETKIFDGTDSLYEVMKWIGNSKDKNILLSIPYEKDQ